MTADTRHLGRHGEDLAVAHLQHRGYSIVERNYRKKYGEIDIIARHDTSLVFIEVKTRRSLAFGSPAHAITPRKQSRISQVATHYLVRHGLLDQAARFDVVGVLLLPGKEPRIEVLENAFDLTGW